MLPGEPPAAFHNYDKQALMQNPQVMVSMRAPRAQSVLPRACCRITLPHGQQHAWICLPTFGVHMPECKLIFVYPYTFIP